MVQLYKRKGGEVLVNTETSGNQSAQHVDALSGGGFIIAWVDGSGLGADTSSSGIKAQLFDADGLRVGGEFLVNTSLTNAQLTPRVSELPSGRFVVTWMDQSGQGGDASGFSIKGQLFEANGSKVGGEFLVNTATANDQSLPRVTELQGGGFVISWQDASGQGGDASSTGLKAQIFDANAAAVGGEFLVNTFTAGPQTGVELVPLTSGGFAASWSSSNGIRLQLFDSTGAKVGSEVQANSGSPFSFAGGNIAPHGTGFVIVWSEKATSSSASGTDIKGQLFDASGTKVGGVLDINGAESGDQRAANVQALPDGGFIVSWQSVSTTGNLDDVWAQVFDSSGAKVGTDFIVSSVVAGAQSVPKLAVLASGDIVVTWTDGSGVGGDSSGLAVKSQILTLSTDAPTDIALSNATVSETAIDNLPVATLSATGALNTSFSYTILSDTSGGAFRIDGDKLVVDDNHRLDFESHASVDVTVRATDLNGHSYDETLTLSVVDATIEQRYAAGDEAAVPPPQSGTFQGDTQITALTGGAYLVTWENIGAGNGGVRGQLYDSGGEPVGGEFTASDGTRTGAYSVVALPGGGFITFYEGDSIQLGPGSNGFPINAQFFDAAGAPVGGQILVSSTNDAILGNPDAALLGNGNIVAAWTLPKDENGAASGSQIVAQMLDASGNRIGGEFRVNTQTSGDQGVPHVAALTGGGFIVTWNDENTAGFSAQRFDNAGAKVGGQFAILSDGPNAENGNIAALDGGGFVVALGSENGSTHQVEAHIFNSSGAQIGDVLVLAPQDLNTLTIGTPHVAGLPGGGFVVSWSTAIAGGGDSYVTAQIFDSAGQTVGSAFQVENNGESANEEGLSTSSDGDIFLSWSHFYRDDANNPQGDARSRVFASTDILGTTGDDLLVGTSANDIMVGFGGNDVYIVNNAGDQVIEAAGQGNDTVYATTSWALGAGSSVETLSAIDWSQTTALNLTGNELANTIYGNAGANLLNGGGGADVMVGFGGDDIYVVDNAGDQVIEAAGQGNDTVYATTSWALGAGSSVETLSAIDWSQTTALNLTGNELANTLYGNAGANLLNGGGGADVMVGFGGDDVYVVDNAGDQVVEAAGQGNDTVYATTSWALGAGSSVETLSAIDWSQTTALNLTGNELANTIYGNAGANVLNGGAGNDVLVGFGGNDTFAFTAALGSGNVDIIADFTSGADKVTLDHAVFAGLAAGTLDPNAFFTGTAAHDADDRIVYDATTGNLYYDADGNGAGAAVLFATLQGHPTLNASDIQIV